MKAPMPTSNQAAHLRVPVVSQSPPPNSVTHTQPGHGQDAKDRQKNSPATPPAKHPAPSSHPLTQADRSYSSDVGPPGNASRVTAHGLSTHAHGRRGGEKAAVPTGCLCRAGETQKDSLVPEFLPHRRCKSFRVPTASAGVSLRL